MTVANIRNLLITAELQSSVAVNWRSYVVDISTAQHLCDMQCITAVLPLDSMSMKPTSHLIINQHEHIQLLLDLHAQLVRSLGQLGVLDTLVCVKLLVHMLSN